MDFERGVVFVLFVDEKAAGLGFVAVDLVHGATGLFAGFFRQL